MDCVGMFKPLSQGHQYVLTVFDMWTKYTWYIPLFTREADEVLHAYLVHMVSTFGGSYKILSGNSTELKNKFSCRLLPLWEWNSYSFPNIFKAKGTLRMYLTSWGQAYSVTGILLVLGMQTLVHLIDCKYYNQ